MARVVAGRVCSNLARIPGRIHLDGSNKRMVLLFAARAMLAIF